MLEFGLHFCTLEVGSALVDFQPRIAQHSSLMTLANARTAYESCPLCGDKGFAQEIVGDCSHHKCYHAELPPKMRWMRCAACSHSFVDGYFTAEALKLVFQSTQDNQQLAGDLYRTREVSADVVEKIKRVSGQGVPTGRWLDVGLGNAALITTADEYGYDAVGIDLRSNTVEAARNAGLEAYEIRLEDFKPEAPFDVISMADVLEHVPYPKEMLSAARELLTDSGLLFLSMPNSDSFVWRYATQTNRNPFWGEIEHYHNFGRERLYQLLAEFGFEPVDYGISRRYFFSMEVIARKLPR
jgi:SAM-dependent methyltransferase